MDTGKGRGLNEKGIVFVAPSPSVFLTLWFRAIAQSEHYLSQQGTPLSRVCVCQSIYWVPLWSWWYLMMLIWCVCLTERWNLYVLYAAKRERCAWLSERSTEIPFIIVTQFFMCDLCFSFIPLLFLTMHFFHVLVSASPFESVWEQWYSKTIHWHLLVVDIYAVARSYLIRRVRDRDYQQCLDKCLSTQTKTEISYQTSKLFFPSC